MKYLLLLCLTTFTVSCTSHTGALNSYSATAPIMGGVNNAGKSPIPPRKVIKNGRMDIAVKDLEQTTSRVEVIVKTHNGRIDQQSEARVVSMDIRIPSEKLSDTIAQISELGKVSYQKTSSKDATDRYIDVEAKLESLKLLRRRLLKLYDQSKDVKSLIKVEKELARVQGEMDSLEGRLKSMQRDIAYSKLNLTIERQSIPGPLGMVGKGIGWTFKKLWVLN